MTRKQIASTRCPPGVSDGCLRQPHFPTSEGISSFTTPQTHPCYARIWVRAVPRGVPDGRGAARLVGQSRHQRWTYRPESVTITIPRTPHAGGLHSAPAAERAAGPPASRPAGPAQAERPVRSVPRTGPGQPAGPGRERCSAGPAGPPDRARSAGPRSSGRWSPGRLPATGTSPGLERASPGRVVRARSPPGRPRRDRPASDRPPVLESRIQCPARAVLAPSRCGSAVLRAAAPMRWPACSWRQSGPRYSNGSRPCRSGRLRFRRWRPSRPSTQCRPHPPRPRSPAAPGVAGQPTPGSDPISPFANYTIFGRSNAAFRTANSPPTLRGPQSPRSSVRRARSRVAAGSGGGSSSLGQSRSSLPDDRRPIFADEFRCIWAPLEQCAGRPPQVRDAGRPDLHRCDSTGFPPGLETFTLRICGLDSEIAPQNQPPCSSRPPGA